MILSDNFSSKDRIESVLEFIEFTINYKLKSVCCQNQLDYDADKDKEKELPKHKGNIIKLIVDRERYVASNKVHKEESQQYLNKIKIKV